jgi:hypothetical protein
MSRAALLSSAEEISSVIELAFFDHDSALSAAGMIESDDDVGIRTLGVVEPYLALVACGRRNRLDR